MCRLLVLVAVAVVGVLVAPGASAQCACPTPNTVKAFDPEQYLDLWYEMKRVPREYEVDGECGTAQYSWNADKTAVNVLNSNFIPSTGSAYSVDLLATPVVLTEGKFQVSWPSQPAVPLSNYWVLGTDYKTYSVVYSCSVKNADTVPHITLWVLARDPDKFDATVEKTVNDLITSVGLDASILKPVQHQKGCPSSTCDKLCSTVKPGLDLSKMGGRWWEVQHSPFATDSDKQSCSIAEFSVTNSGVKIDATTFQKTGADSATGNDVTMSLEGTWADSSKKSGEFNIPSSKGSKVCVVDTDYDNWAVLSICLPAAQTVPTPPAGPPMGTKVASGGVFVLARGRGLSSAQQLLANKAVLSTGVPAASMQATPSTPCPSAAADTPVSPTTTGLPPAPRPTSGVNVVTPPALVLLSAVAALVCQYRLPL